VYDPTWPHVWYEPDDAKPEGKTWDHGKQITGGWKFERIREDKKLPNDISTVKSVEVSVRDGITQPELLGALGMGGAGPAR
jgi:hypothetical protein